MRTRIRRFLKALDESTLTSLNTPGYLTGFGHRR